MHVFNDSPVLAAMLHWLRAPSIWVWLVMAFAVARLVHTFIHRLRDYQADLALALKHGCEMPPELTKKWPLGIDRIKQLWETNADGHLLAFLCSIAKDYDGRNNLCQYLLFGPRAYHILHPANVATLLSTNFRDYGFGCRPAVFAPLLGNGIFTQEGEAWRHSRELLRKQFMRAKYQQLEGSFSEHVGNLLDCIPASGVVDLQPLFFSLTLDTTTALLFGRSVYSLRANIDQAVENRDFANSFELAQEGLAKRFRIAPFHFLYNPTDFRLACKTVHSFVEKYIRQTRLAEIEAKRNAGADGSNMTTTWFIDQVAAESDSETDLRDQLLNVLLAGRDTTACCLSWMFRLLVRHPPAMARLRSEVALAMRGETHPGREQIRKMPFLSCVIKESMFHSLDV
ncbi:hypothetical protein KVR01_002455 [Diaporthe batatas]|uniref:uncharacterized protein n=1 Tax=Diaporthe batatas TaxID=748121 RepID=UPI001D04CC63|nr:uncharacterized protein KVR01_002455 [Diaporthe batatas]KAG8166766.1 hypothetical protein KVR01_002455 [Diaporthe batatas]